MKILKKHRVTTGEVEQVLSSRPHFRRVEKGHTGGEDLYEALGQTQAGRYLVIYFIYKDRRAAMPISAREMTPAQRRYYHA